MLPQSNVNFLIKAPRECHSRAFGESHSVQKTHSPNSPTLSNGQDTEILPSAENRVTPLSVTASVLDQPIDRLGSYHVCVTVCLTYRQFQTTDPVEVDSLDGYHTFGLSLPAREHPLEVVSMEYCPAHESQTRKYSTCRTYVLIAACLSDFLLLGVLGFVEYLLR